VSKIENSAGDFVIEKRENNTIWIFSINNPPANTLSVKILDDLAQSLDSFLMAAEAKVLILTGSGERAFCAGANINEIAAIKNPEQGVELARKGQRLCDKIENSDKPIIVAINGLCLGGGNELAMACHLRIASERAKFGQPEITIGIIPGFGGTQRLPKIIGASRARKMILTGDIISAQDAYEIGLVDEIVKEGMAVEKAVEVAKRILKNSFKMVQLSQKAIRDGLSLTLEQGLDRELKYFFEVCKSQDMKEGLAAFKEKRQAKYGDK